MPVEQLAVREPLALGPVELGTLEGERMLRIGHRLDWPVEAGQIPQPSLGHEASETRVIVVTEVATPVRFKVSFAAAYLAMSAGAVALFLAIRGYGETLAAPPPMRVYVLPAAVIDRPKDYEDDLVLRLLRALTFSNLTTPSSER